MTRALVTRYDADVGANFELGGETPYIILDLYQLPVHEWGSIGVGDGKVAYIPLKMQLAIRYRAPQPALPSTHLLHTVHCTLHTAHCAVYNVILKFRWFWCALLVGGSP